MIEFTVRLSDVEQVEQPKNPKGLSPFFELAALMKLDFVRFYQDSDVPNLAEIQVAKIIEKAILLKAIDIGLLCRNNMVELPIKRVEAELDKDEWMYRLIDAFRYGKGVKYTDGLNHAGQITSLLQLIDELFHQSHNDQMKWYIDDFEVKK